MLSVYVPHGTSLERIEVEPGANIPDNSIWFDLVTPTQQEDKLVESRVGISVPTREEMQEIEVTSRLYVENGARYMTATLMCQSRYRDSQNHAGYVHHLRPSADNGTI
jgi:magnesium transporter